MTVRDPGLKTMVTLMAKLKFQSQQQLRMTMGILFGTVLFPHDTPIETAMKQERAAIQSEAARRREEANLFGDSSNRPLPLGPPARAPSLAFLEGLTLMDVGSGNQKTKQGRLERWK